MKRLIVTLALAAAVCLSSQTASAGEPNLGALGLGSMKSMSHAQAKTVRGQTRRALTTVSVFGSSFDAKAGGIVIVGGGPVGGGFIGGIGGVGSLSTATSGYSATGTTAAGGWSFSRATLANGSFSTSRAFAR